MTTSGHSQFCSKHPLHPAVGVCGSCVRERLASLIQSLASDPSSYSAAHPAAAPPPPPFHATGHYYHTATIDAFALPDLKLRGLNLRNASTQHSGVERLQSLDGNAAVTSLTKASGATDESAASAAGFVADHQPAGPNSSHDGPKTSGKTAVVGVGLTASEWTDSGTKWGNRYLTAERLEWDPATKCSDGLLTAPSSSAPPAAATPQNGGVKRKSSTNHHQSSGAASWLTSFLTRPLLLTRVPYAGSAADHQLKSNGASAGAKKPLPPPPTPSAVVAAKVRGSLKAADLDAISEICLTTGSDATTKLGTPAASSWLSSLFHRKRTSRSHPSPATGVYRSSAGDGGASSPDAGCFQDSNGDAPLNNGKSGGSKLQITLKMSRKKNSGGLADVASSGDAKRNIVAKRETSPARSEDLYMLQQNSKRIEEEAPVVAAAALQRCRSVQQQGSGGGIAIVNTALQSMVSQQQSRQRRAATEAANYSIALQKLRRSSAAAVMAAECEEDDDGEAAAEEEEHLRRFVEQDWGGGGGYGGGGGAVVELQRSMSGNFSRSRSWGRAWSRTLSPVVWGLTSGAVGKEEAVEEEEEEGERCRRGGWSRRRRRQQLEDATVAAGGGAVVAAAAKDRGYESSSASARSYVSPLRRNHPALDMRIHSAQ